MPSANVAEWILRLAVDRDRAAAVVGDLLEQRCGLLRLWHGILHTAAASVWNDLRRKPLQLTGVAFWSFCKTGLSFGLAANLVINVVMRIPAGPWPYYGLLIGMRTLPFLYAGWDVGRRSRGREIAAAFPLAGLWLLVLTIATRPPEPMHLFPYTEPALITYAPWMCIAIGALAWRIRSQRRLLVP